MNTGLIQEVTMKLSNIVKYVLFAAAIAGVVVSLPDIKRYIKISTM